MFRKFKKLTCKILERSCHVPACRLDARGWPQGGGSLDRGHAFVHQHGRHHRPHRVGRESGRQTCETLRKSIKKKRTNLLFIIFFSKDIIQYLEVNLRMIFWCLLIFQKNKTKI